MAECSSDNANFFSRGKQCIRNRASGITAGSNDDVHEILLRGAKAFARRSTHIRLLQEPLGFTDSLAQRNRIERARLTWRILAFKLFQGSCKKLATCLQNYVINRLCSRNLPIDGFPSTFPRTSSCVSLATPPAISKLHS